MWSRRLPRSAEPNEWSRLLEQRRATRAPLLDLTEANPTQTGLGGAGAAELSALADPRGADYRPDPRGARAARAAVADYYAGRGLSVDPDEVVLTSGTSESYAHLFRLLCDPGESVLAPSPSYPLFEPLAALEGVALSAYRLAYDGRWHLDVDALATATSASARAVIVVQPNHPTGTCLAPEERTALESLCERHDLSLISDEVFGDFPWPAPWGRGAPAERASRAAESDSRAGLPSLLEAARVPSFVLGGLSKACGMPQLKLGWIAAAGPRRRRKAALAGLEWIADLFLSVATPVQLALPRLLEARHAFRSRVERRLAANLERLDRALARRPELTRLEAEGGWVATLRLPARRGEEDWTLELLRRDVLVHPGHFYDLEGGPHMVISLIVEPVVFSAGLDRLEGLLAEP